MGDEAQAKYAPGEALPSVTGHSLQSNKTECSTPCVAQRNKSNHKQQ